MFKDLHTTKLWDEMLLKYHSHTGTRFLLLIKKKVSIVGKDKAININLNKLSIDWNIGRKTMARYMKSLIDDGILKRECNNGTTYSVKQDLFDFEYGKKYN